MKPFQWLEAHQEHVMALQSLTTDEVDIPGVTAFVCSLYGSKTSDITDARYKAFMSMSDDKGKEDQLCFSATMCQNTSQSHQKSTICSKNVEEG